MKKSTYIKILLVLVVLLTEVIAFQKKYMSDGETSFDNLGNLISLNKVSSEGRAHNFSESVSNAVNKYPDLKNAIRMGNIKVPIEDTMVPQGITVAGKYILITAYDYKHVGNSKCYVLNKMGDLLNTAVLDTSSHVGSIAYDEENNLLWIPDKGGVLNAYDVDMVLRNAEVKAKYKITDLSSGLDLNKHKFSNIIDYLCYDEGNLYIGSFHLQNSGLVKKYRIIKQSDEVKLDLMGEFKVPSLVQGISFFKKDEKKYMALSRSFGRHNNSKIQIFEYDENIADYSISYLDRKTLVLPPMLEQNVENKGDLYIIFESNAKKYLDGSVKVDSICILDLDKIFK